MRALPVPLGPSAMTVSRRSMNSQRASSMVKDLFNEGFTTRLLPERSKQLPRRVASEQAPLANVAAHGGIRGMAGLPPL